MSSTATTYRAKAALVARIALKVRPMGGRVAAGALCLDATAMGTACLGQRRPVATAQVGYGYGKPTSVRNPAFEGYPGGVGRERAA